MILRLLRFGAVVSHLLGTAVLASAVASFSFRAPHALSGTWLPLVVALGCAVALAAHFKGQEHALGLATLSLSGGWLGVAVTSLVLFPQSTWKFALVSAPIAVVTVSLSPRGRGSGRGQTLWLPMLAFCIGTTSIALQRAPSPSTHPLGGEVGPANAGAFGDVSCGDLPIRVEPRLTFDSCAADRFWAVWADSRCAPNAASATQVRHEGPVTIVSAQTRLDAPVFSHLNSFTNLRIERAGLSATLGENPPARFADETKNERFVWLDANGLLHLSQGTRDEKGPFLELAQSKLQKDLVLTLSDNRGPACRLTFEGWAAQASVEASPTAGWGVAQNSVEFLESLEADVSSISLSLAATSVGEGWDTVGHSPGVYRSDVRLESLR